MERKRRMEEKWKIVRWLTSYIEENQERWEAQRREREDEYRRKINEWDKSERFRKIEIIRRTEREEKSEKMERKDQENRQWVWKEWRKVEVKDFQNKEPELTKTLPECDKNSSAAGAYKGPAEGEMEKISEAECGKLENVLTDEKGVVCPAPNGGSNLWG